jgi:hypothetical protein
MKDVGVEMSRYIVGDKVKFLRNDKIYFVKKVEILLKMTYYLLIDEYGNEKECYQAMQIRKVYE